jgi:branched-chain amino acid transport system ATP-binding protein
VQRGVITALIGPNGAGKTTFFNLLTGFDKPNEGSWSFEGKDLGGVPAHKVARRGHGPHLPAHQGAVQAHGLDNMRLGATGQKGENFFRALVPSIWTGPAARDRRAGPRPAGPLQARRQGDDFAGSLSGGSASCSRWPGRSWSSRRW